MTRDGSPGDTFDAVVVGGGIAGAASAAQLSAAGQRVLLIEREPQFGLHATGRSAAVLSETSGPGPVRALAVASRPFLEAPPDGFCEHRLTRPRGLLWVASAGREHALQRFATDAARDVPSIEVLGPEAARDLVPVLRSEWLAAALWEPDARSLDVDALLQAYLRSLRRSGGTVEAGEGLLRAQTDGAGWSLTTDRRRATAGVVVNAAGAWADEVAVRCDVPPVGLVPYKRTAFVFAAPHDLEVGLWPVVMDLDGRFYVEPEPGGLLGSPAEETRVEPHDARADELDVARAVDALAEATTLSVTAVRRSWAGLRTFAPDRVPVIGRDPLRPSFCWAAGVGGYGIKTAPAVATLVVSAITGDDAAPVLANPRVRPADYAPDRFR